MENDSKDMTIEQFGEQLNNLKKDYDAIRALVPDLDSKVQQQGKQLYCRIDIVLFNSLLILFTKVWWTLLLLLTIL